MNRSKKLSLVLLALLVWATCAVADDFMPPEFRGDPLTVTAEWDFIADFTGDPYNYYNYPPDYLNTIGDGIHALGTAVTHAHFSETVFHGADPNDPDDGIAYTLDAPGQIDFFLVNWTDPYPYKHIWIQITYAGQGVPQISSVVGPNPQTNTWTDPTFGRFEYAIEANPNQRVEYWILMPNPDREHIYLELPPFTEVDQVLIDTVSTESPVGTEETSWSGVKALYR